MTPVRCIWLSTYVEVGGLVVLSLDRVLKISLYGFNQALLKKEGDKVKAGEAIALAGDTGGQASAHYTLKFAETAKLKIRRVGWLGR